MVFTLRPENGVAVAILTGPDRAGCTGQVGILGDEIRVFVHEASHLERLNNICRQQLKNFYQLEGGILVPDRPEHTPHAQTGTNAKVGPQPGLPLVHLWRFGINITFIYLFEFMFEFMLEFMLEFMFEFMFGFMLEFILEFMFGFMFEFMFSIQ